ncbi:hypothetical protein Tco_0837518 [Tanacetum coccineum]
MFCEYREVGIDSSVFGERSGRGLRGCGRGWCCSRVLLVVVGCGVAVVSLGFVVLMFDVGLKCPKCVRRTNERSTLLLGGPVVGAKFAVQRKACGYDGDVTVKALRLAWLRGFPPVEDEFGHLVLSHSGIGSRLFLVVLNRGWDVARSTCGELDVVEGQRRSLLKAKVRPFVSWEDGFDGVPGGFSRSRVGADHPFPKHWRKGKKDP